MNSQRSNPDAFSIGDESGPPNEATPRDPSAAPDMNSLASDPRFDAGAEPLFVVQNTYRREHTPWNTPQTAQNTPPELPVHAEQPPRVRESGPEVPRDAQAVLHVVRMRVLSYEQLSRLTYFGASLTVARRRLRRLRERGWIETWDRPVVRGGAPRYVLPTRRALLWAGNVHERFAEGTHLAKIIQLMTPATPRQPSKFEPGVIPMFLAHTEEANDVLISWLRQSGERVLWASSWDCPFPDHVEWRTMPQPDYVLVLDRSGTPVLVFGEHDRGTESREVVARKFRIYRTWIETPEIAERVFGFRSFHVVVSVAGEHSERRHKQLARLIAEEGVESFTTLLPAGEDVIPALPTQTSETMDFTHCSFCQSRVPLNAEACPSCGAPTHQLAREELTAEASPPLIDYPTENDAPDVQEPPSSPPPQPPP